ncbi:MAG: glycosyltransferase [Reinekea sp.]
MALFSVIISAYNNFEALLRALPYYEIQSNTNFEILIADDGSNTEQTQLFQSTAQKSRLDIKHVWHEDQGFDKCGILNKAILAAKAERLLFTDADMVPRFDLIENHLRLLKPNRFISGGSHINLSADGQAFITDKSAAQMRELFQSKCLSESGFIENKKQNRVSSFGLRARCYDLLSYRNNAFSGANASCWKRDALAINGFDENWGYGGLDRDFGIRLTNARVSSRRYQYSLVALHQDHKRPYRDAEKVKRNKEQLKARLQSGISRIEKGIDQHSSADVAVVWHNRKIAASLD